MIRRMTARFVTGAKVFVRILLSVSLPFIAAGCAAASVAVAGQIASAVSAGGDVYHLGKLDSADEVRYDHWLAACRAGAADLHFRVVKERDKGNGRWNCILTDDRHWRVDITVDRRTETMCQTRIDVGFFGSEPMARLVLAAIRRRAGNLPATTPATSQSSHLSSDEIPEPIH
jgi:hypothetical protein